MQGILTRIMQSTSSDALIVTEILALRYEAQHYKIQNSLIRQVVSQAQAKARERNERDVVRALDKASQSIAKSVMWVYIPIDCLLSPKLRMANRTSFDLVGRLPQVCR